MSDELVYKIAEQIVSQQLHHQWWYYTAVIALSIVGAFVGSYASSFAKKKGELSAVADKFDELKKQLEINTRIVEAVKAEVSHRDWNRREWISLRRSKLEELLICTLSIEDWLDALRDKHIKFRDVEIGSSPVEKIRTLLILYFPELESEGKALISSALQLYVITLEHGQQLIPYHFQTTSAQTEIDPMKAEEARVERLAIIDKYIEARTKKFAHFWREKTKLEMRAHKLILEFMEVRDALIENASGSACGSQREGEKRI